MKNSDLEVSSKSYLQQTQNKLFDKTIDYW